MILTAGYLSSVNCRRELLRAIESDKPLLVLLETDAAKGATDEVQPRYGRGRYGRGRDSQ